ncbi:hypothetical protein BH23ACT11_BH23ACT11_30570 [soil metagenome]
MKIRYYPETDSAYVSLSENPGVDSQEVAEDTVLDFDADGNVVGIEIYSNAARRLDLSKISSERKDEKGRDVVLAVKTDFMCQPIEPAAKDALS